MADLYDRVRPSYPQQAISKLIETCALSAQSKVLELGAGSGKATELLAPLGCELTCVEPGAALAQILSQRFAGPNRVKTVVSKFEDYSAPAHSFDCIVAAQAFHWLNPEDRLTRCHSLLRKDGSLALLWNMSPQSDQPFWKQLHHLYDSLAGGIREPSFASVPAHAVVCAPGEELKTCELYRNVQLHRFPWTAEYSGEEFLLLLDTYSNHRILDPKVRRDLFSAVQQLCAQSRQAITKNYVSVLYVGKAA